MSKKTQKIIVTVLAITLVVSMILPVISALLG
jgi:hypothetical protein